MKMKDVTDLLSDDPPHRQTYLLKFPNEKTAHQKLADYTTGNTLKEYTDGCWFDEVGHKLNPNLTRENGYYVLIRSSNTPPAECEPYVQNSNNIKRTFA